LKNGCDFISSESSLAPSLSFGFRFNSFTFTRKEIGISLKK